MAHMYPTKPRAGTRSNAELTLFAALRSKLPDHYLVFHSVKWVLRDLEGGAREGEADFIICHPERGLLVLEVKGGRIRIDGAMDQWFSNEHEIRDPYVQASNNKYSLLRKMKELPFWRNRTIAIGHCVALPDVAVKQDLRLDAPEEITLDGEGIGDLRRWVESVMAYWFGDAPGAGIGAAGAQQLIALFAPSRELRPHLALEFAGEDRAIIQLTEEQFMLLDLLGRRPRVAVRGCAGAGKTTLAVEQARRLASQGFRVLLTCYNRNLAAFLRRSVKFEEPVDVCHFHSVCNSLARKAGIVAPQDEDRRDDEYFNQILPGRLLDAVDKLGPQYDAIVVDEGQDFRPNWWLPLQCLLPDQEKGVLYIFYDDNQNLYETDRSLPPAMDTYTLGTNLRNTQQIHRTFLPFYRGEEVPRARGPEGRPPDVYFYAGEAELHKRVGGILQRLVGEERVPIEQIVILTQHSRKKSLLWHRESVGNWRLSASQPVGPGEVYCTTVHQYKGLESPVVVLAEVTPTSHQDLDKIMYIGCSRARNHLVIVADVALPQELQARLPAKIVAAR